MDKQIVFHVGGLIAPLDDNQFDNRVIIRGIPPGDKANVYFKVLASENIDQDKLREQCLDELRQLAWLYSLASNRYVEISSSTSISDISTEEPFGKTSHLELSFILIPSAEQRSQGLNDIRSAFEKLHLIKDPSGSKNRQILRIALDYYHRSLGDVGKDEKLIDLMVALESLFSKELQEIRLRCSLRVSQLLGLDAEDQRVDIFKTVYHLYDQRSRIVHGSERVTLDEQGIGKLQKYVRESIKKFLYLKASKSEYLEVLDESIYDKSKKLELEKMLSNASN